MAVDYSRIHRLLKILTLIQGSKGWTPSRLATECGTTERTIYRDMKMLEGAGIPYFYDEDAKCYSIHRDFFLPPVQLTIDESLALAALAEHVGGNEQVPYLKSAARAINKIRGQLPAAIRKELEQIEDRVAIKLAAANPPEGSADVYELVRNALAKRKALRCQYESQSNGSKEKGGNFILKPYTLLFNQRAWYVNPIDDDAEPIKTWSWFVRPSITEVDEKSVKEYALQPHLDDAKAAAEQFMSNLHLDPDLRHAVILAATFHDLGKDREQWQKGIGNDDYPNAKWAKSGRRSAATERSPYRHEFGSILDVQAESAFSKLSAESQEIVLHLIAAHHGRARPHFPEEEVFDDNHGGDQTLSAGSEVPRRFAKLQRKFGRWGLAYIESLVRAADISASRKAEGREL